MAFDDAGLLGNTSTSADRYLTYADEITVKPECFTSSTSIQPDVSYSLFCSRRGPLFWSFESFVSHFDDQFCSHSNMSRVILCSFTNFHEACSATHKGDKDMDFSPSLSSTQSAVDYTCNFHTQIDQPCIINQLAAIRACVKRDVHERIWGSQTNTAIDGCKLVLTITLCLWENLKETCGEYTASIMIGAIHPYLKPQKCYLSHNSTNASQKANPDITIAFISLLTVLPVTFFSICR